jgi:regulator of RNase E activity RraA
VPLDQASADALLKISTATLTSVLFRKGLSKIWMRGPRPIRSKQPRVVGRAFTMRFIPAREDLATHAFWTADRSARAAIEEVPPGSVVVVAALGETHAGIFGDIFCARMKARGVAGLITDGAMRDSEGAAETGLPVWCQGAAAAPSVSGFTFANWQEPIGCGGVAVLPDDIVVADDDGAVVVPMALLDDVVRLASEQEQLEAWIMGEVRRGAALPGLYPPDPANRALYEASITAGKNL